MKFSTLVLMALMTVSAFAEEYPEEDDVLVLGKGFFNSSI